MSRRLERWFGPTSPVRAVIDLLWLGGFVVVALLTLLQSHGLGQFQSAVHLDLIEGTQRRGLYREGKKLGEIEHEVRREEGGWRITERFFSSGGPLGHAELKLRRDLSLREALVEADLRTLAGVHSGVSSLVRLLGGDGKLNLFGSCSLGTGECVFSGSLGARRITHGVTVGRGPVLPSAVYPLLARGVLGKQVELNMLDPLSLQRRSVTFTLRGRRELRLGHHTYDALLVEQRFSGIESKIWLDREGKLLKETLPLGLSIQHESWSDPGQTE